MKTVLSVITIILWGGVNSSAQIEVPNGNFEVWDLYNIWTLEPQYWETPNNQLIFSTMPDSNAFEGDLAMKIVPLQGFEGAVPQSASVIFPVEEIPATLNFAVKAHVAEGDPNDQVSVSIQFIYEDAIVLTETWTSIESIDEWIEIVVEFATSEIPLEEAVITVQAGYSDGLGGGSIDTWISVDAMSLEGFSGMDDASLPAILVYPNPSSDFITLNGLSNSTPTLNIRIFDVGGRDCSSLIRIQNSGSNERMVIDITAIESGLYQLLMYSKDSSSFIHQTHFVRL